jgi:hypothetical protein
MMSPDVFVKAQDFGDYGSAAITCLAIAGIL